MSNKATWKQFDLERAIKDVTEGKGIRASARNYGKFVIF